MIDIIDNDLAKAQGGGITLSVLIPYYKDDPSDLLRDLIAQTGAQKKPGGFNRRAFCFSALKYQ